MDRQDAVSGARCGGPLRRDILLGAGAATLLAVSRVRADETPLQFGLTPVFLSDDIELLRRLEAYLSRATGRSVRLVTRRTYQEITTLLVSGRLDAAWICGYPFVSFQDRLKLLAVPVWRGDTVYQSYLIVRNGREASGLDDLEGDVHAFSDPDSNSGYLVTRALLARRGIGPDTFFDRTIFTYGHRNVVRAVASGLVQSGSVDGYVLEVLKEVEPDLATAVTVVRASEWLGFPPVAAPRVPALEARTALIQEALLKMASDPEGQAVLHALRLDGFEQRPPGIFDPIAEKVALVRSLG
ncbi:MAG: PhnD/SsuA/transferrin family substrate-binding protein [Pseudomonadota bacterium]